MGLPQDPRGIGRPGSQSRRVDRMGDPQYQRHLPRPATDRANLVGWTPPLPAACCLCAAGPPLAASDLTEHRLPDKLTLPAIALTAMLLSAATWQLDDFAPLGRAAISATGAAVFFLALALITGQVGGGDVKLAAFAAMLPGWLGWDRIVLGMLAGLLLAAITAAVLIAARRLSRHDPLPLGPFLLAGALIGVLA
jgi:leader peptidase (prepilin peptidase) / N-methyltransferase